MVDRVRVGLFAFLPVLLSVLLALPAHGAHKPLDSQCSDCHSIGGGRDSVVPNTRLIKKDIKVAEILLNTSEPWVPGQPVPCVYCHDSDTVRTNMVGIKEHFSGLSISRHPVNYLTSSTGSNEQDLRCVDCHTTAVTSYVSGGPNPLNPNIHGVDAGAWGWTQGTGGLDVTATYPVGLSPANSDNNTFCTQRCHDPAQTGFPSGVVAHGTGSPELSLELGSTMIPAVTGCLDEGDLTGCHSPHNAAGNTDLITIAGNLAGDPVQREDCGICHAFDDPPSDRASSDYYAHGHGKFLATNAVTCTDCHDSDKPHFNADGTGAGNRLNFVEDPNISDLSDPPMSVLSNCISSNCHAGKAAHSTGTVNVGCLDCHDPHGYEVGPNVGMVRRIPPVSAPASSLYFEASDAYYDSTTYDSQDTYSNAVCDNQDCHGAPGGPGPISNLMNPSFPGTHTGGTGIKDGCGGCHIHGDSNGSFRASDSCTTCHGQPPVANSGGGPQGYAFADTRTYTASGHFKEEDKTPHALHASPVPAGYDFNCSACHLRGTTSGYHNEGDSSSGTYRNVIFDAALNPNALPEDVPSLRSPSYSVSASPANVCLNLYCHGDGQGPDRYNTTPLADQAWDDSLATTLDCEECHGSNRVDVLGDTFFGAPDYANGGTAASTYSAGSALTVTKANSHLDTTKHGRYTCSVCHYDTTRDTDPSDGYTIFNRVHHVDGNIDLIFDGTRGSGSYSAASKSCQVTCHSDGIGSREAGGTPTYSSAVWGGVVACGDCHDVGAALATGSHAVHVDSVTWPNGPGITCTDCHTSDTDTQHADGKVDFNDGQVKSLTTVCDACHGGPTDAALARNFWTVPLYGNYSSGVTCESCHEADADGAAVIGGITAPDTATGFVDRGHGSILGLPWSGNAPAQACVDCHDWQKPHLDGLPGSMGNLPRPLNTIDGSAVGSTSTSSVDTWCLACHDGSPGVLVQSHTNSWVSSTGYREPQFTLNCNNCHDPHSDPANIYMIRGTVTNTASQSDTIHPVVFLDVTGVNSFDDLSSVNDTSENQAGTTDLCATCHYDPSTQTTYNFGGEGSAQHGERRGTDCTECHIHPRGFVATCDQCHAYPPVSGRHEIHLEKYGINSCDNCHVNNNHNQLDVQTDVEYQGLTAAQISSSININLSDSDYDGVTLWTYTPGAPNAGTCSNLYCHGEFTVIGNNLYTSANWGSVASGSCGDCHSVDSSQATGSHVRHIGPAPTRDYGFRYTCTDCHADVQDMLAGQPDPSPTHVDTYTDVVIPASYGSGAAYNSSTRGGTLQVGDTPGSCQDVTCHGSGLDPASQGSDLTPDWGVPSTGDCGTCHKINLAVQGVIAQGSHLTHVGTTAGQYGFDCTRCHMAVDDENDGIAQVSVLTVHADGVTDVDFDSFNAAASTYAVAGTAQCSNLYCHGTWATLRGNNAVPTWGSPASGACGTCHDNPPSTFAHPAHLASVPAGPGADCGSCHPADLDGEYLNDYSVSSHVDTTKVIDIQAGLAWDGSTLTCATPGELGCHNGRQTPPWDGSADCTDCHAAGGGFAGDPVSALHVVAPAFSAEVQAHDENLQAGTSPTSGCEVCHSASPSDLHYNGVLNQKADTVNFSGELDFVAGTVPTCSPSGTLAACHSDGGNWQRQWSDNAESLAQSLGSARCDVCHGQLGDWRDGLTVDHDRTNINNGTHTDCKVCHVYPEAPYDWAAHHESVDLQYNANSSLAYDTALGSCLSACHDRTGYTMGISTAFAESGLLGEGVSCGYCHGDDTTDPERIWPDENSSNNTARVAYADDQTGAHVNHILAVGQYLGFGATVNDYAVGQQAETCRFCHPAPGAGHATDSGDQRVDLLSAGAFQTFTPGAAQYGTDTSALAYSFGSLTCSNLQCHNRVDTPADWVTPSSADCLTCHPTASYTNRHDTHVTDRGYGCTQCHVDNGSDTVHQDGEVNLVWINAPSFENSFGGGSVTYGQTAPLPYRDATWGTCASTACHDNKTTPTWDSAPVNQCAVCHDDVTAAGTSTGLTHVAHTSAAGTFGRSIDCVHCHQGPPLWDTIEPSPGHINGTFTVSGSLTFAYDGTYDVAFGSCGTNECHNLGDGTSAPYSAGGSYSWGSTIDDCVTCHNYPNSASETGNEGTRHTVHVSNGTYVPGLCGECHPSQTAVSHIDGSVNVSGASNVSFTDPGCTNDCHLVNAGTAGDWADTADLDCTDCHDTAGIKDLDRGWPPTSGEHVIHKSNTAYVDSGVNDCVDCHNDNWTGHSPLDITVTSPALGAEISTWPGDGSCTNDCHFAADAGEWAAGTLNCVDCHVGTKSLGVGHMYTSGLHAVTPRLSQTIHDDSLTACDTCHTDIIAALSHINGTWQADTAANTEDRGLFTDYNEGSPGSCSGSPDTVGAVGCHDGGGEQGSWARIWSTTVTASDGSECANCHGTFVTGFTFPTPSHNVAAMTDTTNHGNCSVCHVYDAGPYGTLGWNPVSGGLHGDDQLTMNTEPTVDYNQTTWSCDGGICHSNTSPYVLSDSGWTIDPLAGPGAACTDCHGNATNGTYWPDGSTSDPANDEPGEHQVHFQRIAARQGYSTTTTNDAEQKIVCAYCHVDPAGANFNSGTRLHNNGARNVNSYIHPIWQTYAVDFATSDGDAVFSSADGSCAAVDCHNNRSTSPSYDWNDGVSSACTMCHVDVTVDAPHASHIAATTIFGVSITCDTCHVDGVVWGTTAPAAGHIYGSWTMDFTHAGNWGGVAYDGSWSTGSAGSCGTNPCHNDGTGNTPAAAYTWGSSYTDCVTCHESSMATLSHDEHLGAAASFGVAPDCTDCHAATSSSSMNGQVTHIDALVTMADKAASYDGLVAVGDTSYGSCLTNACHNDGKDGPPVTAYTWGQSIANCTECHNATAATQATESHDEHLNASGTFGIDTVDCASCHTMASAATHIDRSVTMASEAASYTGGVAVGDTNFGTCETNACHNDGRAATPNTYPYIWGSVITDCTTCHLDEPITGSHTPHVTTSTGSFDCYACHVLETVNSHINGSVTLSGEASGYTAGTVVGDGSDAGTCGVNACHNDGKGQNPASTPYTWGTAIDGVNSCTECHGATAATQATESHDEHLNASGTFGIIIDCVDCHTGAVFSSHMDASVTLSGAALNYVGGTSVGDTSFGGCQTNGCHNLGDGVAAPYNAGGAGYAWGDSLDDCTTCHNYPNTVAQTGNEGVRHTVHVGNTAYVGNGCDDCHGFETSITHIDTAVDFASSISTFDTATGNCTNTCHEVVAASAGDWADTADLACRNCHSGTYIGGGSYLPLSGLHDLTPTVSGVTHAEALSPGTGCGVCHTGMVPMSGDPASHIDGTWEADAATQTETRGLFGDYTDGTPGTCSGSPGTVGAGGCHDGPGEAGSWARRWDTSAGASGGAQCANCHGDFATGWVSGTVNHDRPAMTDTANHDTCAICHNYDDLASYGVFGWRGGSRHGDDQLTMNADPSVDYNQTTWTCDGGICHSNDAAHQLSDSGWSIEPVVGPAAACTSCHGTAGTQFYPSGIGVNGTSYPNRPGKHANHINAIKNVNPSMATTNADTCDWCHPGGGHSGDQLTAPADLHNGSASHYKDILGNTDSGESVAQSGAGSTVSCSGINCHYNNAMPDTEWYGTSTTGCNYCHIYNDTYEPGMLPNAHDIHVDEVVDGGYNTNGGYRCTICHAWDTGVGAFRHQNGIVDVSFPNLSVTKPANGNEVTVAGTGPLAGAVKYGGGTSSDYPTCVGIYCHGDFGDNIIDGVPMSGGNTGNTPNWSDTVDGAACGTCHGDTGQSNVNMKAAPVAGDSGTVHPNHVAMGTSPEMNCSVCHYDFPVPTANGTYGDTFRHADGSLVMALYNVAGSSTIVDTGYEGSTGAPIGSFGDRTCSNIKCHNGVLTPVWSDASLASFGCGDCHHDTAGTSPLPSWASTVAGSHEAHADTDSDYSDCAKCHGVESANYSASGGTNHLNLVVDLVLPGAGAVYVESYTPNGSGGVNWVIGGGTDIDDGTCDNTACHGSPSTLPQWGVPGTVACGSCHVNGMPPISGAHASHFADSDTDYSECIACHGDYTLTHVDFKVDVSGTGVTWSDNATAGTPDDDTCTTTVCHSASPNQAVWGDTTASWGGGSSIECNECHYWEATPDAGNNGATAGTISELSHDGHFAATGRMFVCTDCHASVSDDSHITDRTGAADGSVLAGMANAVPDEALIDEADSWFATGGFNDTTNTCTNVCHDPSVSGGTYSATWGGSISGCTDCHSNSDPGTGSHTGHLSSQPLYGKSINCGSCHDDNSGSPDHMNGTVDVAPLATLSYTGSLNAPYNTTFGTCTTPTCHNDGTGSAVVTSAWGTTIADPNCGICHADPMATLSHDEHLNAAGTFGRSIGCTDCHDATSSTSMNGRITHIDGTVDMASIAASYDGGVTVGDASVGGCQTNECHNLGDGVAAPYNTGGAGYAWGDSLDDCTTCHNYPNTVAQTGSEGARHTRHVANTAYVSSCASCHPAASGVSHINASADMASQVSVYTSADGSCTNTCHVVTAASTGDWLDTADLACRDCHSGTYIGGGPYLPVSGLHDVTPTVSGATHAEALSSSAGCGVCHTGMVPMSSDPISHVNGTWEADGATQTETRGLFGDYTEGTPGSCSGSPGTVGGGGCHDGPGDAGSWSRLWDTSAGAVDGSQCGNCHGDFATGWVTGVVNHDRPAMTDTTRHDNCTYCHVYDNFTYGSLGWGGASRHGDDQLTMNADPSVDYNQTTWTCDGGICHTNDAAHQLSDSAWAIDLLDGPDASCGSCHGTAGVRYYPDGTGYPDRPGKHGTHVTAIASTNALSATNDETCVWCHPGGAHSGDQLTAPADLHDGTATEFLSILGVPDAGAVSAGVTQAGSSSVGCSGIDCHYETDLPDSGWYTGPNASCSTCHTYPGTYTAGELPNAHDIHVDEFGDQGYDLACNVCHTIPGLPGHENGIVDVTFPALAHTDGDEAVAGSGGSVKFGLGTPSDYYSCENIYCHGDFDDASLGGGNIANAPNWGVSSDGDCGTCHGDTGGTTESLKAVPVTGNSGSIHPNHVGMATSPDVTCTVCHYISWGGATNGTYGNVQQHANGTLFALELNGPANSSSQVIADYENFGAATSGGYGNVTCSNVRCHNGVTTPVWSDASISSFGCGDCHQDAAGTSPLPTWNARVAGSHGAHADTDGDYTDCDKCHGVVAGVYTAVGGTNHQNLIVELDSLPGIGATPATYTDPDPAGVNWSGFDYVDDGTCSSVTCHGSGTPVWGGTVACGECHTDGQLPPTTGAHTPHFAAISGSNTDYTECVACHGVYTANHADGTVDVNGAGVAYDSTTNTCNTTVCHSPSTGSLATTATWSGAASLDCYECHYWEAVPDSTNNSGNANSVSGLSHSGHFDAAGRTFACADCHGAVVDLTHISAVAGSDGTALKARANAVQDNAFIDTSGSWFVTGAFNDTTNTCTNVCHDPSVSGSYSAAWGGTSSSCTLCHSMTDPASASHSAHLGAEGTYGLTVDCTSCHPDNGTVYDHMDGAVALSLAALTYGGDLNAPYATTFGTCSTTTCHNDGTGAAVATSTWGTAIADPTCGICHAASPVTAAHGAHLSHPAVDCTDCHAATSSTSMSGQAGHMDDTVDLAARAASYDGGVAVGDTNYGTCDSGACHDAAVDIAWDAAPTDCADCHYNSTDVNSFDGQDKTASVVAAGEWAGFGHSAQGAGVTCANCHDLGGTSHDFSAALDSTGNPFRLGTTIFVSGQGCNTQGACHTISVVNHSAGAITGSGSTVKYTWSLTPECLNCHDPHGDGSNRFMISKEIWDEETGTFSPTGTPPVMPTEQISLAFTDTTTGITGAGDSYADSDSPFSSLCQECHTQTGGGSGFADDTAANYNGHPDFPGNPGDCGACHTHARGFAAGCSSCHDYPPTSGAHAAHGGTAGGKPEFDCQTCHGPNLGSAAWHNESGVSTYDSNDPAQYANVTFNHNLTAIERGSEDAYYNTTWTRSGASVAPTVTRTAGYAFECSNVYCHGLAPVTWTWDASATGNPAGDQSFRTCGGCHGLGGDVDGNGSIDTASFRSRAGTLYTATNTAVNYIGPLSGYSRGGHGDTLINDAQFFEDTASGWSLPVGCVDCHDAATDHFPVASGDRFRVGTVNISDASQTTVTNLCIKCHAETASYHFLEVPKHPSDNFDVVWGAGTSRRAMYAFPGMPVYSTQDPAGAGVGIHIDQYVDHWAHWGNEATATPGDDFTPFLPLGDSLDAAWDGNNETSDRVTCITCHNPHGSDLFVNGGTPGSAGTDAQIPANLMLRLRNSDGELCGACHR